MRGLEQQQAAIDALTRENMSLTESFNANGSHASTLAGEVEELRDQVDTLASAAERALEERDAALNGSAASAERALWPLPAGAVQGRAVGLETLEGGGAGGSPPAPPRRLAWPRSPLGPATRRRARSRGA